MGIVGGATTVDDVRRNRVVKAVDIRGNGLAASILPMPLPRSIFSLRSDLLVLLFPRVKVSVSVVPVSTSHSSPVQSRFLPTFVDLYRLSRVSTLRSRYLDRGDIQ